MKLHSVLASALIVVGVTACAVGDEPAAENTGTTQEALCVNYPDCLVRTGTKRIGGGISSSSGGTLDPGTSTSSSSSSGGGGQTFTCNGKASLCLDPENRYLACNADRTECVCMQGCGGNGWPFGTFNPCLYGGRYTCTSYGYCTCA